MKLVPPVILEHKIALSYIMTNDFTEISSADIRTAVY